MARPFRCQYEGTIYHVTVRGNERRSIFRDDEDRRRFRETLRALTECTTCGLTNREIGHRLGHGDGATVGKRFRELAGATKTGQVVRARCVEIQEIIANCKA